MVKLFLVSFEWLQSYGTKIVRLKSRTQRSAVLEVIKLQDSKSGPPVPGGYTVVDEAQLRAWKDEIGDALGQYADACWTVEDVLAVKKKMTRAQAEEWLHANSKYIQEAMVRAGWETIELL